MTNRYGGTCYRCGKWVPKGEGVFERVNGTQAKKWAGFTAVGSWLVQHHECGRRFRGTDVHYKFNPATNDGEEAA